MSNSEKSNLSGFVITLLVILAGLFGGVIGSYANYYFMDKTTDTELRLSYVHNEFSPRLIENNETELLEIKTEIILYNDQKASYPATLLPPKYEIIDNENLKVIDNSSGSFDKKIVKPGEIVTIYGLSSIKLTKSGNYTLQATIYYLDPKLATNKTIEFYTDFIVYSNNGLNKNSYYGNIVFDEHLIGWKNGRKYPFAHDSPHISSEFNYPTINQFPSSNFQLT